MSLEASPHPAPREREAGTMAQCAGAWGGPVPACSCERRSCPPIELNLFSHYVHMLYRTWSIHNLSISCLTTFI